MTTILYAEPELVIAHGRKVLFINPNDLQIFKDIEVPSDLTAFGLKVVESNDEQQANNGENKITAQAATIQNIRYSPDRQIIALTTTGQKALLLYRCRPEHSHLLSVRSLARASSALAFAPDSSSLLITDKTGDCYQFDCVDVESPPRLLLGHLSIVYDILWTPNLNHIITCDRDDKIRITNYPATYDIHSYCLGHKEFVSGLALLTGQYIASISGDKTLRIWNYVTGKELLQYDLPAPAVQLKVRKIELAKSYQAAVLFYDYIEAIGLYELQLDERNNDTWTIRRKKLLRAESGSWNISDFALANDRIYVLGALNERLTLRVYNSENVDQVPMVPAGWLDMVISNFEGQMCVPEDLSVWFKKRYDNVSDYMNRKKRRIEEKHQKS